MAFSLSSGYLLGLTEEGDPQRLRESTGDSASYLGFDPQGLRLVEIHDLGAESTLGRQRWRALEERLALARRLHHPHLSLALHSEITPEGRLICVTEFAEGEPLVSYLRRLPHYPKTLGVHLALQVAEAAGYLADFPRLLATVSLEDFSVTLDRGRHLALRLTNLGIDRDDAPVSDAVLGAHWIETVGRLLRRVLDGAPLTDTGRVAAESAELESDLDGTLGELISRLKRAPGSAAIRELKCLGRTLEQASGLAETELPRREWGEVSDPDHLPRGPLAQMLRDSAEFEELTREKWRPRPDAFPPDGATPFLHQTRAPRPPSATLGERGECLDLLLLPPERLVGGHFLPRLNRQMGNGFLKEHPYLTRSRSLVCDRDFTLVASEPTHGFSLLSLVTRRGSLTRTDSAALLEEINRLLAHLEGADLDLDRLDPWRLVFHFGDEPLHELLASVPVTEWPAFTTRLRPVPTTESLTAPEAGAWRYLLGRRLGGKSLPALLAWMLEGERFAQLLVEGIPDQQPLSESPALADLLEKAARHLRVEDPGHRRRFLELFAELTPDEDDAIEECLVEIEEPTSGARRGWLRRAPVTAA